MFLTAEIIAKKRDGKRLSEEEIGFFVSEFTGGSIPDYQMAAFLMAAFIRGLDRRETSSLTKAMLESGRKFDLSLITAPKVDKHSTGGVGDKVSLVLAPWVASCGVAVPMISGRGLGHTGGTLDKLSAIPGFRTDFSVEQFTEILRGNNFFMAGQTVEIAPADKKIYALRDVTGTVPSIPFITASILSKKLAGGAEAILFDVKVGKGAFMRTPKEAKELASWLCAVSRQFGVKAEAVLTRMDEPLGRFVGNVLEVKEALEFLSGRFEADLYQVTEFLAVRMLGLAGIDDKEVRRLLSARLLDGTARQHFRELVRRQGGFVGAVENPGLFARAEYQIPVRAPRAGWVWSLDAREVGLLAIELGAGRKTVRDKIDYTVGFEFLKKTGAQVEKDENLAFVYSNSTVTGREVALELGQLYDIRREKKKAPGLILKN
jgi:pyrimidine-nucleoside phosphorylase